MSREILSFAVTEMQVKAEGDQMTIEGYASTFGNVDQVKDIVVRGAFNKSLEQKMPKMLYQHDTKRLPGIWTAAAEDTKGLYMKGKFLNTTLGRDVYEEAKSGAIDMFSIGYSVRDHSRDQKSGIRYLKEVGLHEVSLVTFPANDQARVVSVKSLPETVREFEEFLRDAGYSNAEAKAIASRGFKEAESLRDADDVAVKQSLNKLLTAIKH